MALPTAFRAYVLVRTLFLRGCALRPIFIVADHRYRANCGLCTDSRRHRIRGPHDRAKSRSATAQSAISSRVNDV